MFPWLTNGGFETDGGEGAPYGWRKIGGTIASAGSPVHSGNRALELRSATTSTKWAYQTVLVDGGQFYRADTFARPLDPGVEAVFLRVSWYASADGSGQAISSEDSKTVLDTPSPSFRALTTGPVAAPDDARSARVRLMLRPASGAPAVAHFDDVEFVKTAPPTPTSAPTATATPLPEATSEPEPSNPAPSPPDEPLVFAALTNGSFEDVREDGTPYGWRKVGGDVAATDNAHVEGGLSLQLVAHTPPTKWAYQVITVEAGKAYEFTGFAALGPGASAAFLRVSWYESTDGSGAAISSDDSPSTNAAMAAFQYLSTGPITAPDRISSAKLRLVFRPAGAAIGTVCFDALSFGETTSPVSSAGSSAGPNASEPSTDDLTADTPSPGVLRANATPLDIANVTPVAERTDQANISIIDANQQSQDAGEAVSNAVEAMDNINQQVQQAGERVQALTEASTEINGILTVIKKISDQTNLLALNATIEAARAGEVGKGFAVVAHEVKELSHQTKEATENIVDKIKRIQQDVSAISESMQGITAAVGQGGRDMGNVNERMGEMAGALQIIAGEVDQVTGAMQDQSDAAQEVDRKSTRRTPVTL